MKGHKEHHHRKHKADGGKMEHKAQETPESGSKEWEEDEKSKPMDYTNESNVPKEAEEKKRGGKAKKNRGGTVKKNVGGIVGSAPKASAARAPRKSGGRTGSDGNPFSSARAGTPPKGHKTVDVD